MTTKTPDCCAWCQGPFPEQRKGFSRPRTFCSRKCKDDWGNWSAANGKALLPIALAWRTQRGRKGTSGAAAYRELVLLLDKLAADLSQRGVSAKAIYDLGRDSPHTRTWRDQ